MKMINKNWFIFLIFAIVIGLFDLIGVLSMGLSWKYLVGVIGALLLLIYWLVEEIKDSSSIRLRDENTKEL